MATRLFRSVHQKNPKKPYSRVQSLSALPNLSTSYSYSYGSTGPGLSRKCALLEMHRYCGGIVAYLGVCFQEHGREDLRMPFRRGTEDVVMTTFGSHYRHTLF